MGGRKVVQPVLHRVVAKEVGRVDEQTRERLTDKVYRTLILLLSKQEGAVTDYELRTRGNHDTKEPA